MKLKNEIKIKKNTCERGDVIAFNHNIFEVWFNSSWLNLIQSCSTMLVLSVVMDLFVFSSNNAI